MLKFRHYIWAALPLAAAAAYAFQIEKDAAGADRWQREASNVTIVRDDWGIAHVTGKTDADAIFGMIYAQAEDDFFRVENNYINTLGRLAEVEGEGRLYQDLRTRLFNDPETMKKQYAECPAWLQALMNAWADGLNFYMSRTRKTRRARSGASNRGWR